MNKIAVFLAGLVALSASGAIAGEYCREYTKTVTVGGKLQSSYGTACLQPDGDWKIISQNDDYDKPVVKNRIRYIETQREVYIVKQPVNMNKQKWRKNGHRSFDRRNEFYHYW